MNLEAPSPVEAEILIIVKETRKQVHVRHKFVAEIDERLRDFFSSGARLAWIINPDAECVEVCHAPDKRRLLGAGAELDGEQLLPGFRYPIADLFKDWDWE